MTASSINMNSIANTLAISGLSEDTAPDINNDFTITYDASAGDNKKVKLVNLPSSWQLISTATASVSAYISFTGLSSTYKLYRVVIQNYVPNDDATSLWLRTSTNGGSTYDDGASDYKYGQIYSAGSSAYVTGTTSTTNIPLCGSCGTGTGESRSGYVDINTPSNASRCWINSSIYGLNSTPATGLNFVYGCRDTAADVDAIRFLSSSGDMASGTFTLYGLR